MKGLVLKSTGSWYKVLAEKDQKHYSCNIKGHFRTRGIKTTNPIAVGDFVDFEKSEKEEFTGIIYNIHDRKNYIVRKSINLSKQYHIIASNIDQLALVVTLKSPQTSTMFIDRYLLTAEAYGIPTTIIFNKIDLLISEQEKQMLKNEIKKYNKIGYQTLEISVLENINTDQLKKVFKNKVSLISGHSGVGKSTIMNHIEPNLNIQTAEISDSFSRGKHTTTFAEMHPLSYGGFIIDSPGIKSFSVVDINKEEYYTYFRELFSASHDCKFHNCLHLKEPGCEVKRRVESLQIHPNRYRNYLHIYHSDNENYRSGPKNLE